MKLLTTLILLIIPTLTNASSYPFMECEDLEIDVERFGVSELNGLSFTAEDTRATVPLVSFSFGANSYVEFNGNVLFKMYNVVKEENKISFTTANEMNHIGRFVDYKNAYKIELENKGDGEYSIMMFEDKYKGEIGDRELYWIPFNEFVSDSEDTSALKYQIDKESIRARKDFKCVG